MFDNFEEVLKRSESKTIKDIADRYKEVLVKCPCCEHKLKIKVKV